MLIMHPCAEGEFEWIRTGREELRARNAANWKGNFVSNLLPSKFDAYAKILHSVEASYKIVDDPHPLTQREIAILRVPRCKKLRAFVENLRREGRDERIRWKTLAQLLGVPFDPEICHEWFRASMEDPLCWPRFLTGPADGNLNAKEFDEAISVLRDVSGGQDCFFQFAKWPLITKDKPLIYRGALDELAALLSEKAYQFTPEYWWPVDRSWCLCSEYDLKFTIVGGSKDLISAVLNNATLEALEVNPQTRIDDSAPIPR
jgi:hypothetical protein